jgi:outer membrane immunogenic protein
MKHHLLRAGSIAVVLACGPAIASDAVISGFPPYQGQPPLPDVSLRPTMSEPSFGPSLFSGPPPSWSGLYIGLNAGLVADGGGSVNIGGFPLGPGAFPSDVATVSGSMTPNGASFIGGGGFGFNYQVSNAFFAGVETDFQGSTLNGASSLATGAPYGGAPALINEFGALTAAKTLGYLGTVRGRVGFLLTPAIGVFGTAGLAYGQVGMSTTSALSYVLASTGTPIVGAYGATNYSGTRAGWTAGGGLEAFLSPCWSAKVEYLYYDLGSTSVITPFVASTSVLPGALTMAMASKSSTSYTGHIARIGINYHFPYAPAPVVPAPVIAKY